jgi:hypothetical protein
MPLPTYDTLHDIQRQASIRTSLDGTPRQVMSSIIEHAYSPLIAVTPIDLNGVVAYKPSKGYECTSYQKASIAVEIEEVSAKYVQYKVQWSMDGNEWLDDKVAVAGAVVGGEIPYTMATPIIQWIPAAIGLQPLASIVVDIKGKWIRIAVLTEDGSLDALMNTFIQFIS